MTMTEMLEPDLLRLRAPNPSPLTGSGTNTYVLGQRSCVVIDPGPDIDAHLNAILAACAGRLVEAILVTHSHRDHSTLAPKLAAEVDAPVCAFGRAEAGRSARMTALMQTGDLEGGEGLDHAFEPDARLADGAEIALEGEPITALHTPGHLGNHLCFAWRGALFSGDHMMNWSTTLISPPDGDLTDFMASCARLAARQDRVYYPGHGDPVTDPAARVSNLIAHRKSREMQVLAALRSGPATAATLTETIYSDVPRTLWPAAERNVLAHLIDLTERALVAPETSVSVDAKFALISAPSP